MGKLSLNGEILQYSVKRGKNSRGADCIKLKIILEHEDSSLEYCIYEDTRATLDGIHTFLEDGLDKIQNNHSIETIHIGEYLERDYIFVSFGENGNQEQFTANKC